MISNAVIPGRRRRTRNPEAKDAAVALMVWTAPYGIICARLRSFESQPQEPSVNQFIRIGMDTSKHLFQLHGVNAAEAPVLKKKLIPTALNIDLCP